MKIHLKRIAASFLFSLAFAFVVFQTYAQQKRAGQIIFTEKAVAEADFNLVSGLQNYELTNRSNLFMTVFLARPLTSYLQELAPELAADSLVKLGNYQFSFYIDERLVYRTELLPGAPRAVQQHTLTAWNKPLIDNQHEGAWWSQSAWNRFLYSGGDSALTEGNHRLKLEFRPYLKTGTLKTGPIIASGMLQLKVNRKPVIDLAKVRLAAPQPYPGFSLSSDKFDHEKIKALKGNIEASVFKHITSVVVIKNGKLLIEEYFNGANRDSLHDVRSVGKSFASTLTGMAIKDGLIRSETQTLSDFYDLKSYNNYSGLKAGTSLKDLLTMSSDFDGDDDDGNSRGNEENMYPSSDWVKFALDLPMDTLKYQGKWHYFTVGAMLLGSTLDKVTSGGLEGYAEQQLFKPLGISKYQWPYTPQKVISTAGGIRMQALDLAKYGQLYKNNGRWKGRQLIPQEWVKKTFTRHQVIPGRKNEYYGYLFWNKTYHVNGKAYETFYCAGNGGNKIFVFKDQPLVVVVTATAYGTAYGHSQVDRMMENYILPAVMP